MPHDDSAHHATTGELDRAVEGLTKAVELGFQGVNSNLGRMERTFNDRLQGMEAGVNDMRQTLGSHQADIEALKRAQSSTSVTTVTTTVEDNKPVLTFGDVRRFSSFGKAIWPVIAAAGGALMTWVWAHWPKGNG